MTVVVRPVDLDSEQQELLRILQRNLPGLPHADRFEWLYRRNPAGPTWAWFACDKDTGGIVGVASLFLRAMWVGGKVKLCGQVGDFAIDPSHRSLGPAVLLQRATFDPVNQGILAFCYDCPPHEAGMSTFRRLGIEANSQMYRYARPLRVNRQLEKRLRSGAWVALLAPAGNLLLRLRLRRNKVIPGLEIAPFTGRFGEEFSQLDEQETCKKLIRGRRRAVDLNWHYREDPLHQYRVLTARRGGELVGYAIFSISGELASVVDLFGKEFPQVGVALLEAVVDQCNRESVQTVQAFLSEENEFSIALRRAGFCYRSTAARVVAYAKPGSDVCALLGLRPRWSFSQAEILA